MNLQRLQQRLVFPAASQGQPFTYTVAIRNRAQCRWTSSTPSNKASDVAAPPSNPLLDLYYKSKDNKQSPASDQAMPQRGDLSPNSIFNDTTDPSAPSEYLITINGEDRNKHSMLRALDPVPDKRRRWEGRKVTREIRRRGRMSKLEALKQSERQSLTKSPFWLTSTKKLGMLARQIAGKTLDEAMIQMRFSKKKSAMKILEVLDYARNEAIVKRGMGLGKVEARAEQEKVVIPYEGVPKYKLASWQLRERERALEGAGASKRILLKDGKKHTVSDPTRIYIDQAWVGKGKTEHTVAYHGRGRRSMLDHRYSSISVLLKEEKTRVREHEEREAKEERKKPWLALPDRPVTAQHQYPLW